MSNLIPKALAICNLQAKYDIFENNKRKLAPPV